MKKICILIIIIILFTGCSYSNKKQRILKTSKITCNEKIIKEKSQFILDCIKSVNTNEEPEDWITLCEEIATKTFCKEVPVILYQETHDDGWTWYTYKTEYVNENVKSTK